MASNRIKAQALIAFIAIPFMLNAQVAPIVVIDGKFEAGAEAILRKDSFLLQEGGAKVIEHNGEKWFVAIGITMVREPNPVEQLRLIRVGKINAQRAAVEFMKATEVTTSTTFKERTTIDNTNGKKETSSQKTLDEETKTKVEGVIKGLSTLGTWKSADCKLFFYAIGAKL